MYEFVFLLVAGNELALGSPRVPVYVAATANDAIGDSQQVWDRRRSREELEVYGKCGCPWMLDIDGDGHDELILVWPVSTPLTERGKAGRWVLRVIGFANADAAKRGAVSCTDIVELPNGAMPNEVVVTRRARNSRRAAVLVAIEDQTRFVFLGEISRKDKLNGWEFKVDTGEKKMVPEIREW